MSSNVTAKFQSHLLLAELQRGSVIHVSYYLRVGMQASVAEVHLRLPGRSESSVVIYRTLC